MTNGRGEAKWKNYGGRMKWYRIRDKVLARDKNKCRRCGATKNLRVHHILPLSKGGKTVMRNLITRCKDCHDKGEHKGQKNVW